MVAFLPLSGLPMLLLFPQVACSSHDRGQNLKGVHQTIFHNNYEDFHKAVFDSGKILVKQSVFYRLLALLNLFLIYAQVFLPLPNRNRETRSSSSQITHLEILEHFHDHSAQDSSFVVTIIVSGLLIAPCK